MDLSSRVILGDSTNIMAPPQRAKIEPRPVSNVHVYDSDVIRFFLDSERMLYSNRLYIENQPEVTERMRKILVDWLADVVIEFKLHSETFFLAVDIIDRFLSLRIISRSNLQLVGIAAILIAAKHEEIWPPAVRDCVVVTANTYTSHDIIVMEREIACVLHFKFTVPTSYSLMTRQLEVLRVDRVVHDASFLFLESASHCYPLLQFLPSRIAAASIVAASVMVYNKRVPNAVSISVPGFFNPAVFASFGVAINDVRPIVEELIPFTQRLCSSTSRLIAVKRKYSTEQYSFVSTMDFPSLASLAWEPLVVH